MLNKLKRKGLILIECNFPRFNNEDKNFIYKGIKNDLSDNFGRCYNIEVNGDLPDNVVITGTRKNKIKERAISIEIYKMIKKLK